MLGKQPGGEGRIDTILGESCRLKGDIQVDGGIRIDGDFEGTLRATEAVVVGKTGSVRADINSEQVTVGGKVFGNILGKRRVFLETGAHVEGDVTTTSLVISEGVYFQGGCRMSDSPAGTSAGIERRSRPAESTEALDTGSLDEDRELRNGVKQGLLRGLGRS